jgi:pilus assembly protein Flp/PilA
MDILRTARGRAVARRERWSSRLRAAPGLLPARTDDESGQGLAEYALILALIAIVAIAALAFFGLQISSVLTDPVNAEMGNVLSHITNP